MPALAPTAARVGDWTISASIGVRHLRSTTRFRALDPLRGILCILVVLEHASVAMWEGSNAGTGWEGWLRCGLLAPLSFDLGAPLFFVISGYCIAGSLQSMLKKDERAPSFLAKRVWRIFPPYWFALLGLAVLVTGLDLVGLSWLHRGQYALELYHPWSLRSSQWLGNLTLTESWRPLVAGGDALIFSRICWSLCYQEQFYLVCLAAFWLAPRRLVPVLGWATAAIVAIRIFSWDIGANHRISGLFFDYWHQFAAGLFVYWRLNLANGSRWRWGVEAGLAVMAAVGYRLGLYTTTAAALLGLLLIGLHRFDDAIDRRAWLAPLRALGARSYGVYLAHLPACVVIPLLLGSLGVTSFWGRTLITVPLATVCGIASGWAFHALIDRHFQHLPAVSLASIRRLPWLASRPAANGA